MKRRTLYLLILLLSVSFNIFAQKTEEERSWNQPVEPFKIAGNIYYVGASDVTSYLIITPKGHILIDSGFIETVPLIRANIAKLGFKLEDVKIILNSHAHYDHAGGIAELRRLTGAKFLASKQDVALLTNGGLDDPNYHDRFPYEGVTPDETFIDGRKIKLGGTKLTANITAGHTPGCTTWTMTAKDAKSKYNVVFICSTSAPGYDLIDNKKYPNIISDYNSTFERLKKLKVDIFLASHGGAYGLTEKAEKLRAGAENPFVDPAGYLAYLKRSEEAFRNLLRIQQERMK
jgi:metallo-beta-lactamase class B